MDEPRAEVVFRDFPGMVLAADPHDRKGGLAVDQVNFVSTDVGELQTRSGIRLVSFEDD